MLEARREVAQHLALLRKGAWWKASPTDCFLCTKQWLSCHGPPCWPLHSAQPHFLCLEGPLPPENLMAPPHLLQLPALLPPVPEVAASIPTRPRLSIPPNSFPRAKASSPSSLPLPADAPREEGPLVLLWGCCFCSLSGPGSACSVPSAE